MRTPCRICLILLMALAGGRPAIAQCPEGAVKVGEQLIGNELHVKCRCAPDRVLVDNKCTPRADAENREFTEHFQVWLSKVQDSIQQDRKRDRSWLDHDRHPQGSRRR